MSSASMNGSADVSCRENDLAGEHRVEQVVLAEVLVEPARPHDRPVDPGRLHDLFGALGLVLTAPGEQNQPLHSTRHRQLDERSDRVDCSWHRQIRVVRQIDATRRRVGPAPRWRDPPSRTVARRSESRSAPEVRAPRAAPPRGGRSCPCRQARASVVRRSCRPRWRPARQRPTPCRSSLSAYLQIPRSCSPPWSAFVAADVHAVHCWARRLDSQ